MAAKEKTGNHDAIAADERKGINSVEIGLRVLDVLVNAEHSLPLKDISRLTGLSRSQSHRYLTSLIRGGMVTRDPITAHYGLGSMALRVGLAALDQIDAFKIAENAFVRLVNEISETSMMAVWGERGPVTIRWRRGTTLVFSPVGLGSTFPLLKSATGLLFLAFLPDSVTKTLVELELKEAKKKGEPINAKALVSEVRARGYATLDEHLLPGHWATSAPVFDSQGEIVAGITIMGTGNRMDEERQSSTDMLLERAAEASHSLGWVTRD